MSQNDYSTQGSNFISATQGSVDPRTGLFSFAMPFASLTGNNNLGPQLDLSLSYNPTATDNQMGLGIACTFGTSYYDLPNGKLYTKDAEVYNVVENNNNTVTIKQKKLANFNFIKENVDGVYVYSIRYKTGEIEELKGLGGHYVPSVIYSPTGRMIKLDWTYDGQLRLNTVSDETTVLCQLTYGATVTADVYPETTDAYTITCHYENGFLTEVQNNRLVMDNGDPGKWTLGYKDNLLTSVIMPTGLKQEVLYNSGVMAFPVSAHLPALPAVVTFTETPGFGQPKTKSTFDYNLIPGHNYLGGSDSAINSWSKDEDPLMNTLYYPADHPDGYEYGSTETHLGENDEELVTIERRYNSLHLMTQQLTQQLSCKQYNNIDYPLTAQKNVDDQVAQYQLPELQTTIWENLSMSEDSNSRTEQTTSEYDDAGNPIRQVDPDGTETTYEYFPAEGEPGLCPAEPNGFVRFVKSKMVTPAPSAYTDVPVMCTTYTYRQVALPDNRLVAYAVLQEKQEQYCDGTLISTQSTTYIEDTTSADFGRMQSISRTVHDTDTDKDYTTTATFVFSIDGEKLLQQATIGSWDQKYEVVLNRVQSRLNGLLLSQTDRQNNVVNYKYDLLGRILEKTSNPGTRFENTVKTSYFLSEDSISTQQLDSFGNIHTRYFDGKGRVLRETRNLPSDASFQVSDEATKEFTFRQNSYDYLGRLSGSRAMDSVGSQFSPDGQVAMDIIPSYNNWGQSDQMWYSTGQINIQSVNPVLLQVVAQLKSADDTLPELGKKQATLNLQRLPVRVENIDAAGNVVSEASNEYDGAGQLRSATDEQGNVTTYTYDCRGRMATQTLPDGTVVSKTYAPFTAKALPTSISVKPEGGEFWTVGSRDYDSLGRLIRNECGGRIQLLSYTGNSPVADKITTPAGDVLDIRTIPELGNALAELRLENGDLLQWREYDSVSGDLTFAADNSTGNRDMFTHYSAEGFMTGQRFFPQGGSERSSKYGYSVMGKPLWDEDVTGVRQDAYYDQYGRLQSLEDPSVSVQLEYDDYGRMATQRAEDKMYGVVQKTALAYDDFGREITRQITATIDGNEQELLKIEQTFLNVDGGMVDTRLTTREGEVLRDEAFFYDERNRLVDYTCQGSELPQNTLGLEIERQNYTFDALNNITECVTTYTSGEDVATFVFGNPLDPCQLTGISHSSGDDVNLEYDANGRLIHDEGGRVLSYDVQGRLLSVTQPDGSTGTYGYDGTNRLVSQFISNDDQRELYYRADVLINELQHGSNPQQSRMVKLGNSCVGVNIEPMS